MGLYFSERMKIKRAIANIARVPYGEIWNS